MEDALPDEASTPNPRKKRIPRACAACRRSKVKCDEQRPCSRCRAFGKDCVFAERPPDPYESLREEIESLKARLHVQHQPPSASSPGWPAGAVDGASSRPHGGPASVGAIDIMSPTVPTSTPMGGSSASPGTATTITSAATIGFGALGLRGDGGQEAAARARKRRKRSHYEVATLSAPDLVNAGVIPTQDAEAYFGAFFSGCHRFVPVFDPGHDTMDSVRRRSPLLFGTICSVGCRVLSGPDSHHCRLLGFHTQRMLNAAVLAPSPTRGSVSPPGSKCSVETIQALLVKACYASERSLLVAIAMRMAIDLGLPEAYDTLTARSASRRSRGRAAATSKGGPGAGRRDDSSAAGGDGGEEEEEAALMRKTRTWLHIAVMSHIMHVDAGDLPTLRFRGAASRCRILLESQSATDEDLHLLPQVELNAIRARIRASLAQLSSGGSGSNSSGNNSPSVACPGGDDEGLMDVVRGARIDIDVWFGDWTRVLAPHLARLPWLAPNLAVQRFWADGMAMCSAVRCLGLEDVSAMTPAQRAVLLMAKASLRDHLDVVLQEPRLYLANLRYAADFVWAKNAFCLLLLLKLDMLLPDGDDDDEDDGGGGGRGGVNGRATLVAKSRALLAEFARSVGPNSGSSAGAGAGAAKSNTGAMYLHLVRVSIEKYSQALQSDASRGDGIPPANAPPPPPPPAEMAVAGSDSRGVAAALAVSGPPGAGAATSAPAPAAAAGEGGQTDLESFVPDQFVFEWDFPGLTLFSSPTTEATWFDDFLTGALDGADDFYGGLGWASVDFSV
ncbi:hypothetical protein RB595_008695 [Gaeumannomyces hyphopodioides]